MPTPAMGLRLATRHAQTAIPPFLFLHPTPCLFPCYPGASLGSSLDKATNKNIIRAEAFARTLEKALV